MHDKPASKSVADPQKMLILGSAAKNRADFGNFILYALISLFTLSKKVGGALLST